MDHTYVFDFDQFSRLQAAASPTTTGHRRCASLPWTPPSTARQGTVDGKGASDQSKKEDLFHLSPASISYLRSRSELVATLASLVGLIDKIDLKKDLGEDDLEAAVTPTGSLKEEGMLGQEGRPSPRGVSPDITGAAHLKRRLSANREKSSSPHRHSPMRSEASSRSTSPGSVRMGTELTLAEYRYRQQVQRFPHIWRHILNQVVPLESARDPDLLALSSEQLLSTLCHRELGSDSRTAVLVSPSDSHLHSAALTLVKILMLQRDWLTLVRLLQGLPELLLHTYPDLRQLHDFACCCVSFTSGELLDISDTDSNDLWRHLLLVRDVTTRSRTVLSMVQFWSADVAVELLEVCYHGERPADEMLLSAIEKRLGETKLYKRVSIENVLILSCKI